MEFNAAILPAASGDDLPRPTADLKLGSKLQSDRECGRHFGCGLISPKPAGQTAGKSTSWKTSVLTVDDPQHAARSGIFRWELSNQQLHFPRQGTLAMTSTFSLSSGKPEQYAFTSTASFMRPKLPPIFLPANPGSSTTRFSSILNLAVGGNLSGSPNASTAFRSECWWTMFASTHASRELRKVAWLVRTSTHVV